MTRFERVVGAGLVPARGSRPNTDFDIEMSSSDP